MGGSDAETELTSIFRHSDSNLKNCGQASDLLVSVIKTVPAGYWPGAGARSGEAAVVAGGFCSPPEWEKTRANFRPIKESKIRR